MTPLSRSGSTYKILRVARNQVNRKLLRIGKVDKTSSVHQSARVSRDLRTEEYVFIGRNCEIGPLTRIGRYTMLATGVAVVGDDHVMDIVGMPMQFAGRPRQQETIIARDVWIGRSAVVRRGTHIGEGAVVGAGAVVTRDVEPYSVVAGIPAKKIGERFANPKERDAHRAKINGPVIAPAFAEKQY